MGYVPFYKIECKNISRVNKILNNVKNLFNINYSICNIGKSNKKSIWLHDSGAGELVTNNKDLLINFKKEKINLRCANNTLCEFEGYSKAVLTINKRKVILERVYYSKDVVKNMISGIELAKSGVKSLLNKVNNDVILRLLDKDYKIFASFNTNKNNEAYIVSIDEDVNLNERNNIMSLQNFENLNDLIWHRRLGHFYNSDLHGYLKFHEASRG